MHTKKYTIDNWAQWDKAIDQAVQEFHREYGIFPHLLLASDATFAQIDAHAKREHIAGTKAQPPPEGECVGLNSFANQAGTYRVQFCLGEDFPLQTFELIHDDEAEVVAKTDPAAWTDTLEDAMLAALDDSFDEKSMYADDADWDEDDNDEAVRANDE